MLKIDMRILFRLCSVYTVRLGSLRYMNMCKMYKEQEMMNYHHSHSFILSFSISKLKESQRSYPVVLPLHLILTRGCLLFIEQWLRRRARNPHPMARLRLLLLRLLRILPLNGLCLELDELFEANVVEAGFREVLRGGVVFERL